MLQDTQLYMYFSVIFENIFIVSFKDMLKYTFLEIKKTNYRDQSFNYKWFSYMKKKYELR